MRGFWTVPLVVGVLSILVIGCESLTGRSTGEYVDDAAITTAVKTKLTAEKASNFTRIDVDTKQGVVYLTGVVSDEETKTRAEDLAEDVDGVTDVVNHLSVKRDS